MTTDAARALREHGLRVTPQRRAILAAFAGGEDEHLSADDVHARASSAVPGISRGTVYATLAELADLGLIAAVGSPEPVRFETNVEPHQHFRCRQCLRLFDVALPPPAPALPGYLVERVAIIASGVCAECRDFERGVTDGAADLQAAARLDAAELAGCHVDAPFGALAVGASPDGLVRIAFAGHADFPALDARRRRGNRAARGHADDAARWLSGFLAGAHEPADVAVDWNGASGRAALEAAGRIPFGEVCSYERLGVDGDRYELGRTFGANPVPILYPCHRVRCGSLVPPAYSGGPAARTWLTAFEQPTAAAGS
jgi:Fe2+ or Zn2+ uptake regulation protein/O6-methylguanine-DNA--protein-cysteine methyltransferase